MRTFSVIGISGVTNSGKTSLTQFLEKALHKNYDVFQIHQDDYIKLDDPKMCCKCGRRFMGSKLCSEDNTEFSCYHDWENLSAFHMDKMWFDIQSNLQNFLDKRFSPTKGKILIIEGFTIFEDLKILSICDTKIFLTLCADECKIRRSKRNYNPGDPEGYFEKCVWPAYQIYYEKIKTKDSDVFYVNGGNDQYLIHNSALEKVMVSLKNVE
ncbi:UNVERIFIED_CONTAM: hypothetical protein RMT77_010351 [Armadillidium vulgare]